jgi:hypothetical protein
MWPAASFLTVGAIDWHCVARLLGRLKPCCLTILVLLHALLCSQTAVPCKFDARWLVLDFTRSMLRAELGRSRSRTTTVQAAACTLPLSALPLGSLYVTVWMLWLPAHYGGCIMHVLCPRCDCQRIAAVASCIRCAHAEVLRRMRECADAC